MSSYYVDEIDGVFFTDRTAATEQEFRDRIAAFEGAPTPPEVREAAVLEEVARAIAEAQGVGRTATPLTRRLAAAAVAAYRATQDGGAEEAVRRVLSLAESIRRGEVGPLNQDLVAFLIRVAVTDSTALADREWLREMFVGPARDLAELPEWARPVVTPQADR